MKKTKNLSFGEMINALMNGDAIKLPEWGGFWVAMDDEDYTKVQVFTKDYETSDTPWYGNYIGRQDWEIADEDFVSKSLLRANIPSLVEEDVDIVTEDILLEAIEETSVEETAEAIEEYLEEAIEKDEDLGEALLEGFKLDKNKPIYDQLKEKVEVKAEFVLKEEFYESDENVEPKNDSE